MTLTIYPSQAYALLAGLFIGKFTNLFSDVVITGLVLYIVTPEIFTEDRLDRAKNYFWSWFPRSGTHVVKIDELTDSQKELLVEHIKSNQIETSQPMLNFSKLPKIEIVTSPKPISTKTK